MLYVYASVCNVYIRTYTFSSCLLQDCNVYYFVSQCRFSHVLHDKVLID